jgi:histone H3/H4
VGAQNTRNIGVTRRIQRRSEPFPTLFYTGIPRTIWREPNTHTRASASAMPTASKRHGSKKKTQSSIKSGAYRRLASRAGVRRITDKALLTCHEKMKSLATEYTRRCVLVARSAKRTVVNGQDVVFAFESNGFPMMGA